MKNNGHEIVKVGMEVIYRGSWGYDAPKNATIESIEYCGEEHCKYGDPVEEIEAEYLHLCVIDLSDGHWAYGYQVSEIIG